MAACRDRVSATAATFIPWLRLSRHEVHSYLQAQLILACQLFQAAPPAFLLCSLEALLLAAEGIAVCQLALLPALYALLLLPLQLCRS